MGGSSYSVIPSLSIRVATLGSTSAKRVRTMSLLALRKDDGGGREVADVVESSGALVQAIAVAVSGTGAASGATNSWGSTMGDFLASIASSRLTASSIRLSWE